MLEKPKIVVVVGPTSSGKTSLSIDIATEFTGEVISADSRQVYRGMDLGSGKVTSEEMGDIPHHLLDVADPMEVYTAADFARDGAVAIEGILNRDRLPIIAGGTFFYVDTLLGKISTPTVPPNEALRAKLEEQSTEVLFGALQATDPRRAADIDQANRRRVIRALEIVEALGTVPEATTPDCPYDVLSIGIGVPTETLHKNIHTRLLERLKEGMVAEVERLIESGVTHERLEDLGLEYRYLSRYLRRELSYDEMVSELEIKIRQFAKRQLTWLKRDKSIEWHPPENREAIFRRVREFLG